MEGTALGVTGECTHDRRTAAEPDDEELLGLVLGDNEAVTEAAFRALVSRHGPMVLGVCRQILGRAHDAEDAFQATFLVLAQRAGSIRNKRVLAGWLHEVAYRTAVRAKARSAHRRTLEKEAAKVSGGGRRSESAWIDLGPVLHEEINRLPGAYRSAVVLCYLEGRTNEEAAALLQWPVGTVKGRLSRARAILRSRLTRRGLALSAALLMARLAQRAVSAGVVPPGLAEATARGAVAVARGAPAGTAAVASHVLELVASVPAKPPRLAGHTLLWAGVATGLLLGLTAALGGGPGAAVRLVVSHLAAMPNENSPGGCHNAR
jgi:RNA polymerase sigma factor (sigma-70 family)